MFNWVENFIIFAIIAFIAALISLGITTTRKELALENQCLKKCGITRIKIIDEKCLCKHQVGWFEPGKKINFKINIPQKKRKVY